jgi:hypothetical protein
VRLPWRRPTNDQRGAGDGQTYGKWTAAFFSLAVLVPQVAAVVSVALYVGDWPHQIAWLSNFAVPIGIALTLFIWALGALVLKESCTAQRMDSDTYGTLLSRLEILEAQAGLTAPPTSTPSASPPAPAAPSVAAAPARTNPVVTQQALDDHGKSAALREVKRSSKAIRAAFRQAGMPWVLATGYVQVWTLLHAMDEALIEIEPCEAVVSDALLDEARLAGSTMDNRDDLLEQLRLAVHHLGPDASAYLVKQPPIKTPCPPPSPSQPPSDGTDAHATPAAACEAQAQARATLRTVRHAINEYRDIRRGGLVRARNQLMATVLVTGITVYLLLGLAILLRAPAEAVVGAVVFFLVGASVGLFNRLAGQSTSDNAVDDFGLSVARLTLTPIFSGLAAIGGVLLTTMLFSGVLTPLTNQSGSTMHGAMSQTIETIYRYTSGGFPFNIVVAAVFGLTPGLFLSGLQQQSDKLKADLKSSQASSRGQ